VKFLAANRGCPAEAAELVVLVPRAALDPAISGSGQSQVFAVVPSGDVYVLPISLSNPRQLELTPSLADSRSSSAAGARSSADDFDDGAGAASSSAARASGRHGAVEARPGVVKVRWALVNPRVLPALSASREVVEHLICLVVLLAPLPDFYLAAPCSPLHPKIYGPVVYVAWNSLVEHWRRALHGYLPTPAFVALATAISDGAYSVAGSGAGAGRREAAAGALSADDRLSADNGDV